jgi:hypothetical protein
LAVSVGQLSFTFTAADITKNATKIVTQEDWDFDLEYVTARRIGRVMGRLRLAEVPRPGGIGSRKRSVSLQDLAQLAQSYNIALPSKLQVILDSGTQAQNTNGSNGINGSNGPNSVQPQTGSQPTPQKASQPSLEKDDALAEDGVPDPSTKSTVKHICFACHTENWKKYPDGSGEYCATCHPG